MAWLKKKAEAIEKQNDSSGKAGGQAFLPNCETEWAAIFKARSAVIIWRKDEELLAKHPTFFFLALKNLLFFYIWISVKEQQVFAGVKVMG